MCYVAATPKKWSSIFEINTIEDIRNKLNEWAKEYESNGKHGQSGWFSDQVILYKYIKKLQYSNPDEVGLVPWTQTIPRLDRAIQNEWINPHIFNQSIFYNKYVDFHLPNYKKYNDIIYTIMNNISLFY
jgi:hypothetical protein